MRTHSGERESCVPDYVMVEQARLRARVEAAVEALLAMLDGDADLEPDNDAEPLLGWCDGAHEARYGGVDNGEEENEHGDELDTSEGDPDEDREPALGWNAEASQAHLMGGVSGHEDEPSLGAPEGILPAPHLHWDGYSWSRAKGVRRFRSGDQTHWGEQNGMSDAEEEFDGREDDDAREIEHEAGEDELWPCE